MLRLLFALALLASAQLTQAASVVDATGVTVTLEGGARRIVSLAPHATELLYAAGAGERVVGAVDYSDYPAQAAALPRVGSYDRLDIESILQLNPDLVVAWASGNPVNVVERLAALGIPVFRSEPSSILGIADDIESLGKLAGVSDVSAAAANAFRQRYESLRLRYADRAPVQVFYQIWANPLMTINGMHLISRVMDLCGGRNVFRNLQTLAPQVSLESVLSADPEVILMSSSKRDQKAWQEAWRQWPKLRAVAASNIYALEPDHIHRHTPRLLDGFEQLCIHLDAARAKRK